MKRIIAFAASLLALVAMSSCQKLEPTEITASERVNHVTVIVNVTCEGVGNVPAGTVIDLLTSGTGIHVQRATGGQYGNQVEETFGCSTGGETVTAKATVKINGSYYNGSASATITADSVKLINLTLKKI